MEQARGSAALGAWFFSSAQGRSMTTRAGRTRRLALSIVATTLFAALAVFVLVWPR